VFFIVVVNAFIPGTTVRWVTSKLRLLAPEPPAPQALLEVSSTLALSGKVIAFFVDKASAAAGVAIADLPFPDGAGAMLVVRGSELVAPRGDVVLVPGDHLYVVTRPDDEPQLRLLLGQQEEL
jgi:cell volume regulation protein A